MNISLKFVGLAVAGMSMLGTAAPATAAIVNYTAGGNSVSFELTPGGQDVSVSLSRMVTSVDLTPGVAKTVTLNNGSYNILLPGTSGNGSELMSQTLKITSGSGPSDADD